MEIDKDKWELQKIEIEFQRYGSDKGKYIGNIRFQNGHHEHFQFNIRSDMAENYIQLISEDIVKCAGSLSNRLIESLGLNDKK